MKIVFGLLIALLATSAEADPHGRRWYGRENDRIGMGRPINLGMISLGNSERRYEQPNIIYVSNNPHIQCNLTHLRLFTQNDSVLINAIEVEYRDADRYGNYKEFIDLRDDDDYDRAWGRRRENRAPNGIFITANDSTPWLDVDDVMDGIPDGRCIQSIKIFGIDYPPRNVPGSNRRWRRWYPDPRAIVYVEGLILDRRPPIYNPGNGEQPNYGGHHGGNNNGNNGPVVAPVPAPQPPNGRPGTYPGGPGRR